MKLIEQYIQFALDNGYGKFLSDKNGEVNQIQNIDYENNINVLYEVYKDEEDKEIIDMNEWTIGNMYEVITSKSFIEAIARGLSKILMEEIIIGRYKIVMCNGELQDIIETLTTEQAIAIRDNKQEEFITNLGIGN